MTIRPGEEWGVSVPRPTDLRVAADDRELAEMVSLLDVPLLGVAGGDIHRMLGAPGDRPMLQRLPMDLLRVEADQRRLVAVAHVLVRRSWWRDNLLAVCNVGHIGRWNVAPRAHPNDGRFDVVEVAAAMPARERWQARSRLRHGGHVPHPSISTRTAKEASWVFDPSMRLWVDGVAIGEVRRLTVEIEPDAYDLHV